MRNKRSRYSNICRTIPTSKKLGETAFRLTITFIEGDLTSSSSHRPNRRSGLAVNCPIRVFSSPRPRGDFRVGQLSFQNIPWTLTVNHHLRPYFCDPSSTFISKVGDSREFILLLFGLLFSFAEFGLKYKNRWTEDNSPLLNGSLLCTKNEKVTSSK